MQADDVKVILILSSWSSGSTSVAGFLDKCGCWTCPPHLRTVDDRTPNAYEPQAYRKALLQMIDENTLKPVGQADAFVRFFADWVAEEKRKAARAGAPAVVLKHPLQAFLLPAIRQVTPVDAVVVSRPFAAIEATRARRNWGAAFGEAGANVIYGTIYNHLHESGTPYIAVPYDAFRADPAVRTRLLAYLGLSPGAEAVLAAEAWLR
ncbi:hypothetical protein LXM94_05810 [Rhizobium sp. TRM95111]|uniref:hypothetical protein n=1 Tax=Rhizobium alarense TaxID=2846851 RepID=UPI001F44B75F|nr:hypothetical protein [Rhizobium alarense]MCF3639480.1 hypothetical protein [Rhizobium alarense]